MLDVAEVTGTKCSRHFTNSTCWN